MLQNIRSLLLGLWILALLIFLVQNWGSAAVVIVAGQASPALPLSLVLLTAYGVGVGLGFLYVGSWQLHQRALERQAIRKLNQLLERVRFLEAQLLPPDHYLPPDLPDPQAGRYSYSNIPPERIRDPAPEPSEAEDDTAAPSWRIVRRPYAAEEEEEWDS
ncbi:LapA family protein [Synechococcus sp. H65.1]|uniref:LapA family protein n=1 Tax=unclassified Synechococcus TaxID=2626047 RepID=UPI0039C1D525